MISFSQQKKGKLPYRPQPVFMLTQSVREIEMMKKLHKALDVGKLYINRESVNIVVSSITDILTVIIPHFDKYPVKGGKLVSYLIFRKVVLAMQDKMHLDPKGAFLIFVILHTLLLHVLWNLIKLLLVSLTINFLLFFVNNPN